MSSMPTSGERIASMPSATVFNASMSSPESVSSRIANRGWNMCICRISRRFFSPPENPSFTDRVMNESSIPRSFIFSARSLRNCGMGMSFFLTSPVPSAVGAPRVDGGAQEVRDGDAGDRRRVLEGEEDAGASARVDGQLQEVHAIEKDLAALDLVLGVAHDRERERAL